MVVVVLGAKGRTTTRPGVAFATSSTTTKIARTTTTPGAAFTTATRVR